MLRKLSTTVKCTPPTPISNVVYRATFSGLPFQGSKRVEAFTHNADWKSLPHITDKALPQKPTDIKGVDAAAYTHMQRKQLLRNIPVLMQNKFFVLKFVDALHHLSLVRKSNIAYTFSNFGTPVLNDKTLEAAFKKYKGKYRQLNFFQSLPLATDTATERILYRKRVKRGLFQALHKNLPHAAAGDIRKVSGIFLFRFVTCPATHEDYLVLERDLDLAVNKILTHKAYVTNLANITDQQNKAFKNGKFLKQDVTVENTLGAENVPGYFPKLPFYTS